ncbi:uncharacterized protein [Asterias amurensis]|uniref:uncharacterized protein n=1 Tax=Asterias amurensis TaxID=7602 RepID=UPI003AB4D41F
MLTIFNCTYFNLNDPQSITSALSRLSSCISDIKSWMTLNMLKLNEEKTELFIAVPDHLKQKCLRYLFRLDYGNGLLLRSSTSDIKRLQRIQNWAAKLICKAMKYDHATPCLQQLHWLPVKERVTFKVLVTVFKCLQGIAPGYLSSCLALYQPPRSSLRSASDNTRLTEHPTIRTLSSAHNRT